MTKLRSLTPMVRGAYIIAVPKGDGVMPQTEQAFIAETCPACNGGKVVGGVGSPVMACPVCKTTQLGASISTGLVWVPVPVEEAEEWINSERMKAKEKEDNGKIA